MFQNGKTSKAYYFKSLLIVYTILIFLFVGVYGFALTKSKETSASVGAMYLNLCGSTDASYYDNEACEAICDVDTRTCEGEFTYKFTCNGNAGIGGECSENQEGPETSYTFDSICGKTQEIKVYSDSELSNLTGFMVWYTGDCPGTTGVDINSKEDLNCEEDCDDKSADLSIDTLVAEGNDTFTIGDQIEFVIKIVNTGEDDLIHMEFNNNYSENNLELLNNEIIGNAVKRNPDESEITQISDINNIITTEDDNGFTINDLTVPLGTLLPRQYYEIHLTFWAENTGEAFNKSIVSNIKSQLGHDVINKQSVANINIVNVNTDL